VMMLVAASRCMRVAGVGSLRLGAAGRSRLSKAICTAAPSSAEPGTIGRIGAQIQSEIAGASTHPAKLYGFIGACCNWFLGGSAIYDGATKGPEFISLQNTCILLAYSTLFARWAGWAVSPRNYILTGSHLFNVACQLNQLRRCLTYKLETGGEAAKAEVTDLATKAAAGAAGVAVFAMAAPYLQVMMPAGTYLASVGGPFTIHPWPPMTKLLISGASMVDMYKPTDKISITQYAALTLTGAIFSKYGLVVSPINYPLTSVNVLLFLSSGWHLGRKIKADYM